ncbi:hypothetical protein ACH5RR_007030 [Cinchona calisaya]|uniref:F-box associated beta-propeller type 1 domain-containing protein n=1 Tax=Cinchona calisaya TaxID=153742 RepID=A0ABD3AR53_9GENT
MILYFADFQSPDNFKETRAELETPFAMCEKSKFNLVGFCNGIFCIHYEPFDVFLWNPWIKKHHKLPFSQTLDELLLCDYKYFSYGFGYGNVADDYKFQIKSLEEFAITRIPCFHSPNSHNWATGILVNSTMHWLVGNGDHDSDFSILAIDLRTEEYQVFPQLTDMPNDHMWDMAAVEGSLSVLNVLQGVLRCGK